MRALVLFRRAAVLHGLWFLSGARVARYGFTLPSSALAGALLNPQKALIR